MRPQVRLGTIVRVENHGGVPVITFGRRTVRAGAESALATRAASIGVYCDTPQVSLNKDHGPHPLVPGAIFTR